MAAAAAYTDPIPFVRASSECTAIASAPKGSGVRDSSEHLSGDEARTFYERVVNSASKDGRQVVGRKNSASHSSSVQSGGRDLKAQLVKRKNSTPSIRGAPSSTSQLFLFAQEGMLNDLRKALDTSTNPGVDLNAQDMYGWSLLMSSAYAGHHNIVCFLLSKGAEWRGVCDKLGRTAVDLALMAGHRHVADEIQTFCVNGSSVKRSGDNELPMGSGCTLEAPPSRAQQQQQLPFFCSLCSIAVRESTEKKHSHSTLHQFNCNHCPSVHQYGIPMSNKGYKLLVKGGWNPEHGLGQSSEGKRFPVKTVLKRDRLGLGADEGKQARVTHFGPCDAAAVRQTSTKKFAAEGKKKDHCLSKRRKRERQGMKHKQWEISLRRYMNADY